MVEIMPSVENTQARILVIGVGGAGNNAVNDKTVMVEYCVYWLENGEPMHEVFSSLAAAEMYSCAIRGKENIEWVEVSEEETIDLDELEDMFPDDFCGV